MPKKKPVEGKPEVHTELDGFEVSINEFGEIVSNTKVDVINDFLNKHVDDKKFRGLDDIPVKNAKKKLEEDIDDDIDDEEFDDADDDDDEMDDEDLPEEDENEEEEKDPYELDEKDPDLEDIEELVKSMEKDFGKRGGGEEEEEESDDFQEEEFLDEYNDDFSEEDNYNFDEGDADDKY
jgi:hypothetical protein